MHRSFRTCSSRTLLGCLFLLLLGLAGLPPAWAERREDLPPGALVTGPEELARASADAGAVARRWMELADAGSFGRLQQLLGKAGPGLEAELALARLVRHLRDAPSGRSEAAAGLLKRLVGRAPRVWMRHEEARGDWFVPALDPGREAGFALWFIDRERARQDWVARLEAKGGAALATGLDPEQAAAAAEALALVSPDTIRGVLDWKAAGARALPGQVLLALAEREPSPARYAEALGRLDPARRVAVVAELPERLPGADAVPLLQGLAGDAEVGSAAVLALGRFAAEPPVRDWLLKALGDPHSGPSAAAALARHGGDGVVDRLVAHAAKAGDGQTLTHVALALRLQGSADAGRALEALGRDPRLPATLRRELQP